LLVANRAYCEVLGYAEDVLRTMTFQEITRPKDLAADSLCSRRRSTVGAGSRKRSTAALTSVSC
jgi:hypothetical protein